MIRPATLALGILCASAIGTAHAQQRPQPGQSQQGSQQQSQQPGQNQQGPQQKQSEQPRQSAQNDESDHPLERAIDDADKLKTLLQKLGELLAEQFAHGGRVPPELAHSVCDTARQVAELESLLESDIYRAAVDQIQRTGGPGLKAAEDALEEAKENVRALVNAKIGLGSDEPSSPTDCPEFPRDYQPAEEPPPRKLGDKPGELRPAEQVMVSREPGKPSTPVGAIPAPRTVAVAADGVKWCRFGSAQGVATVLTPTDANGNLIASVVPGNPGMTAGTKPRVMKPPSTGPGTPEVVTGRPKKVASFPLASVPLRAPDPTTPKADDPPPASTPPSDTPPAKTPVPQKTSDQTPPPSGRSATPTGDLLPAPEQVTIDFNEKADIEEVAENLKVAAAEPSAALKLKPLAPDLPGRGEKSAQDKGFSKDPATGRMGANGHASITTDEPQTYGMASGPGAPTHYRADIDTPEHAGFIADTAGKPLKPAELANALPAGVEAATETFKLVGRTYLRIGLDWPRARQVDTAAAATEIGRAIGARLETDTCRRTKPAPALGPEPTPLVAIDGALPATAIKLRGTIGLGRAR